MSSPATPATSPVESIDRALLVLQTLARTGGHGMSLVDLARDLEVNKTTVHRTLAALSFRGFVAQDPNSGNYLLGSEATTLADDFLREENLPVALHPALLALSAKVGELVHLGVLSGKQVLYLDKVEPERAVRVWSAIGRRNAAVTTALGRAILAHRHIGQAGLGEYLPAGAPARHDRDWLWEILERARAKGYATEVEENEPGISCLAVPLLRSGVAIAAVSITAPIERMASERAEVLHDQITQVLPPLLPSGISLPAIAKKP